jgi:hypothetical protein
MRIRLSHSTLSLLSTWLGNLPFLYPLYLLIHLFLSIFAFFLRRTFLRAPTYFLRSLYDPFFFLISIIISLFQLLLSITTKKLFREKESLLKNKISQNCSLIKSAITGESPTNLSPQRIHEYYEIDFKFLRVFLGIMSFLGLVIIAFIFEMLSSEMGGFLREIMFGVFGLIYAAQVLKGIYGGTAIAGLFGLYLPMGYGIMKSWVEIIELFA